MTTFMSRNSTLPQLSLANAVSAGRTPFPMCLPSASSTWTTRGSKRPGNVRAGYKEISANRLKIIHDNYLEDEKSNEVSTETRKKIELIRKLLSSMEDGEISVSAYDTAWVALVESVEKNGWFFWLMIGSLTRACVVALKTWQSHPERIQKGLRFIMGNLGKLEGEDAQHMPAGFEVIFPALLEMAKALGLVDVADMPCIQHIDAKRDLKLARIPREVMHTMPTTLLHSLEGMEGLDWRKLLELQCDDGSFLFSIASTAFAFMQTKDEKCLTYLQKIVDKFRFGVPSFYPISIYERLWAVDKLERLGISRHFQSEIMECLCFVHRFWNEKGLSWTEASPVKDLDDTVMGFRLLRLHGFEVSPDVIRNFKKGDEFSCFAGQILEAPSVMFNLYRASQVQFPGEIILEEAKKYSLEFLSRQRACGEIFDKWMILKDLPGEIGYAVDVPWYASLPRLEARAFIDQYGGENDACIGKNIYRLSKVANNTYLELAKSDYNTCQAIHQQEWNSLEQWYAADSKIFKALGVRKRNLLVSYYLAAASIFEPEHSLERVAWAKSSILVESVISYFGSGKNSGHNCKKAAFLDEFLSRISVIYWTNSQPSRATSRKSWDPYNVGQELVFCLLRFLHQLSMDLHVLIRPESLTLLGQAWENWLRTADSAAEVGGSMYGEEAELLIRTINICRKGRFDSSSYLQLSSVANKLCAQLRPCNIRQVTGSSNTGEDGKIRIDAEMELLLQLVLRETSDEADAGFKHTFLAVARSFYYISYFDRPTVDCHIHKVLFETI